MAERKPQTKQVDDWNETVDSEVNACLANTDSLCEFYLTAIEDFAREHDYSYKSAYRNIDNHDALMRKHDRKVRRLKDTYTPTLGYLAELATGKNPTVTPSEESVREVFGVLARTLIGADDYIGVEINNKIRDKSLQKAALAHSGGSKELAEAYCKMTPLQPFLRRFRLSARIAS